MRTLAELAPKMAHVLRSLRDAGRDRDDDPCCPDCGRGAPAIEHFATCELGAILNELDQVESAVGDAFCFRASGVASITATRALADRSRRQDPVRQLLARRVFEQCWAHATDLLGAVGAVVNEPSVRGLARAFRAVRDDALEQAALACDHAAGLRPMPNECAAAIRSLKSGL